jgi:hypothetical protein
MMLMLVCFLEQVSHKCQIKFNYNQEQKRQRERCAHKKKRCAHKNVHNAN